MRTKGGTLLALAWVGANVAAQAAPALGGGLAPGGTATAPAPNGAASRAMTIGNVSGMRGSGGGMAVPRVNFGVNPLVRIAPLPMQNNFAIPRPTLNRAPQRLPQVGSAVNSTPSRGSESRRTWRGGSKGFGYYYPGVTPTPSAYTGQFLYPGAYGYALSNRNEYSVATNPYFPGIPGLAYDYPSFPYFYALSNGPALLDGAGTPANAAPPNSAATPPAASLLPSPAAGSDGDGAPRASNSSVADDAETVPGRTLPPAPNSVIEAVQAELARRGYYSGRPDGIAGDATTEALRRFQRDLRLRPTGRVNQATLFALGLN